jgi:phosphate transport system protein
MEMATKAAEMVTYSIDSFVHKDLQLAIDVIQRDDKIDELFLQVRNEIITLISNDSSEGAHGLDLLMIAKYLERIGDHAVNVAEWVVYSITGNRKGEGDEIL